MIIISTSTLTAISPSLPSDDCFSSAASISRLIISFPDENDDELFYYVNICISWFVLCTFKAKQVYYNAKLDMSQHFREHVLEVIVARSDKLNPLVDQNKLQKHEGHASMLPTSPK